MNNFEIVLISVVVSVAANIVIFNKAAKQLIDTLYEDFDNLTDKWKKLGDETLELFKNKMGGL